MALLVVQQVVLERERGGEHPGRDPHLGGVQRHRDVRVLVHFEVRRLEKLGTPEMERIRLDVHVDGGLRPTLRHARRRSRQRARIEVAPGQSPEARIRGQEHTHALNRHG